MTDQEEAVACCRPFLERVFASRALLGLGDLKFDRMDALSIADDSSALVRLSFDGRECLVSIRYPGQPEYLATPRRLELLPARQVRAIEIALHWHLHEEANKPA